MTTFFNRFSIYRVKVIHFGLMNVSYTFQRMTYQILTERPFTRLYLDDMVSFSNSREEHLRHLHAVMERVDAHGMHLKFRNCDVVNERVELLGHIIDPSGASPDPRRYRSS